MRGTDLASIGATGGITGNCKRLALLPTALGGRYLVTEVHDRSPGAAEGQMNSSALNSRERSAGFRSAGGSFIPAGGHQAVNNSRREAACPAVQDSSWTLYLPLRGLLARLAAAGRTRAGAPRGDSPSPLVAARP